MLVGFIFYTVMHEVIFRHKTIADLKVDLRPDSKKFEPWWAMAICDEGIIQYYAWFLRRRGINVQPNKFWGCHISVVKGTEPPRKELWKAIEGPVEIWYTNQIRVDNGRHAWLDVFSPELYERRLMLGLPGKVFFHMTIGRTE